MKLAAMIRDYLQTRAAVTALVSDRIFARKGESGNVLPYVLIRVDSWGPQGDAEDFDFRNSLQAADVRIECRARTEAAAEALEEAVRGNGTDPATGFAGLGETVLTNGTIVSARYLGGTNDEDSPVAGEGTPPSITTGIYEVEFRLTQH